LVTDQGLPGTGTPIRHNVVFLESDRFPADGLACGCWVFYFSSFKRETGMETMQTDAGRIKESGNVLFLILIAVALFAALSYAVTQSSRSGSTESTGEKSLISSSTLTQYPAGVRTDIIRMLMSNGLTVDQLEFNPPSDFGTGLVIDDTTLTNPSVKQAVFHPSGGGSTYQQADSSIMGTGAPGTWHFNQEYNIPGIGSSKNDLLAWLPNIAKGVCDKINEQLGITTLPVVTINATTVASDQVNGSGSPVNPVIVTTPTAVTPANDLVATAGSVTGQPFACVSDGGTPPIYYYYHALIEQ
jgi:hypothetical protein